MRNAACMLVSPFLVESNINLLLNDMTQHNLILMNALFSATWNAGSQSASTDGAALLRNYLATCSTWFNFKVNMAIVLVCSAALLAENCFCFAKGIDFNFIFLSFC